MVPETLLHYRILQPLGSGGMGDVYLAEDTKLGRRVALKVLPHGPADDPERRQRFEREARTVAALNHPNIVTIHAVEQAGDITFLTMELVDGQTLSTLTPKSGMAVRDILKLAIPLADAVAAAHERGITHRDLKPANVMVTPEGRVKVLDFGLAKLTEASMFGDATMTNLQSDPLTGEGRIVGTVAYMSPEQGEGKPVDHRTDIFSLGVMLYEMAIGQRPFTGDTTVSVLSSILKDTPRSVTDINPSLPRDLARIIKRALVKDPDHRYQTAKDLRNELETLKEDLESGTLEAPAIPSTPAAPAKRGRGAIVAAALGGVALVAAAVVYFMSGAPTTGSPTTGARPFEQVRLSRLTSTGKVSWSALSADGRYVAHVVLDPGKQSLWLRQVATTSNVQIVPAAEVRYDGVAFSPDGNFIYYVAYPGVQTFATLYQVPVLGGTPRKILDDVDTPPAFSPDGREFAFVRGYTSRGEDVIHIAGADGSNERPLLVSKRPLSFLLNTVAWSPDGSTIVAVQRADGQRVKLVAVDVKTARQTDIGSQRWPFIDSMAWARDGQGLIVAAQEDTPGAAAQIWYVSYPSGTSRRITNDLNNYGQVSLGADGRTIVAVQRDGTAHLWVGPIDDIARARQITSGTGRNDGMQGLSWTADGRILYSLSMNGNSDIWIVDATGANARQLTVDPADDYGPNVTPDGRSIVFDSRRAGGSIWQMDLDGGNQHPLIPVAGAGWPIVSPDMKWVYYTSFAEAQRSVWRMPFTGGAAERLTRRWEEMGINADGIFYHPSMMLVGVTKDGTHGFGFFSDRERRGTNVALVPLEGGTPKRLDISAPMLALTPDGRHLLYFDLKDGIPTLMRRPLADGTPTVVTAFPTAGSLNFALSRDGKQLALSRGTSTSDVVLMTQEK